MFLIFIAFISGITTIFSPCIWSIMPVIVASSSKKGLFSSLGLSLGVISSYLILTLSISHLIQLAGFNTEVLRNLAIVILFCIGITMLVPKINDYIESFISKLTNRFRISNTRDNVIGSFATGASLGILWTPCSGPIMTMIATLAASEIVTTQTTTVAVAYSIGVGIPIFLLSYAEQWLVSHHSYLSNKTRHSQQFLGIMTILSALLMYSNYDKVLQAYILSYMPFMNPNAIVENNPSVRNELERLRSMRPQPTIDPYSRLDIQKNLLTPSPIFKHPAYQSSLPYLGLAQEIAGITKWFNLPSGRQAVNLSEFRGKVVLLDFWAYTCAPCLPSIPRKNDMLTKYPQLAIVALHEPSTRDGKSEQNVMNAINQYDVHYPVGMDNNFVTWDIYKNNVLPTEYVIDVNGNIRYTTTDGSDSDTLEQAIQGLLKEAGYL